MTTLVVRLIAHSRQLKEGYYAHYRHKHGVHYHPTSHPTQQLTHKVRAERKGYQKKIV